MKEKSLADDGLSGCGIMQLLTNRLVVENLKHRPVRTLLSALAIGVQVTMVLTLVGVSHGLVEDSQERSRGVGADIVIRPPKSSLFSFSSSFPGGILNVVRRELHVTQTTGTFVYPIGGVDTITGINLAEFKRMSGGFRYLDGGPFQSQDDILVDDLFARSRNLHAGSIAEIINVRWRVAGVVEPGKLSRIFCELPVLQERTSNSDRLSQIYVKVDDPANTPRVIAALKAKLVDYPIYSMEELVSLMSVNNVPMLRQFTGVIIGIGVFVGFLVVFLAMYTAVLERTREIGVLKALGASPLYILNILMRETVLLALAGSILGIAMTYGSKWMITILSPTMIMVIVYTWWPIAAGIAMIGALAGAIYPGLKAAHQDAIEALSYE